MSLRDDELLALLRDIESDRVQRKEALKGDAPAKIRQAVTAFANDLPDHRQPGVVFVGAADTGALTGLPIMVAAADAPTPTVLGHLAAGVRPRDFLPGAYVQFLRLAGPDLAAPILDEAAISGRIADVLRAIDEKLKAHLITAVDIVGGDLERRAGPYPLAALQQLARNAVMHRTYEGTNAPVRISWFSDRIEIWNPGGPYGVVSRETFGRPGYADYRNPNLAEAIKALGFVQRFGVGIQTARAELQKNGNPPPSFDVTDFAVNVTTWARP